MTDLTVRGAGVFGLTIALEGLRRGARVTVIDPLGPGSGASGGVVGALAPHAPERWTETKAFQRDCLVLARSYWPEVESETGCATGFRRSGRLQPLADEAAVARAKERSQEAENLWQGAGAWTVGPDPGPFAPLSPTGLWVHDTLSAQLDPPRAIAALAGAVTNRGGQIVTDGPERGDVIHATGWQGLGELSGALGRPVGDGVKGQAAVLDADPGTVPQVYADGLHVVSHGTGRVAVGSTSERLFDQPLVTDGGLDDIVARARAAVPGLAEAAVVKRWAGVRPRARHRGPIVAAWPDRPGHFVANGGFKIGFALAPALAPLAVDLALEDLNRVPDAFALP